MIYRVLLEIEADKEEDIKEILNQEEINILNIKADK